MKCIYFITNTVKILFQYEKIILNLRFQQVQERDVFMQDYYFFIYER